MKRLLLLISLIISANVLFAQTYFTIGDLKYQFESQTEVSVLSCVSNPDTVIIPSSVNYNGVTYSVSRIRTGAFQDKTSLEYVHIPNTITCMDHYSFAGCTGLTSIVIPNSVTTIEQYAFKDCTGLTSIVLGSGLTYIGPAAFKGCSNLATVTSLANPRPNLNNNAFVGTPDNKYLIVPAGSDYSYWLNPPDNLDFGFVGQGYTTIVKRTFTIDDLTYEILVDGETNVELHYCNTAATDVQIYKTVFWNDTTWTVTHIGDLAFNSCLSLDTITCFEQTPLPLLENADAFGYCASTKNLTILFGCDYSLWDDATTWSRVNYLIRPEETKNLTTDFTINDSIGLINKGRFVIEQGGQFINDATDSNLGIIEVKTASLPDAKWSFLGAPFAGYKLEVVVPGTRDVSISTFNYGAGAWSEGWATVLTEVGAGEGFFAWSFAEEPIIFTNYGDGIYSPDANVNYNEYNYDFSSTTNPIYQLNTGDVTVEKSLTTNNNENWMALANPYTFKLDVAKFLADQENTVQGEISYRFNNENDTWQLATSGVINVTEGFFVNFTSAGPQSATFKKSQRYTAPAKASAEREFVRLAMLEGEIETEVLFAQNDEATEEYDIFDANKLFSPVEITEPYFVVNNIALAKEEVNTLPYYATMNVKSYGNKEVTFKANYIPEGLAVSIIDGEETIDLGEGVEYTTNVIAGENADRFKVLIKKSLSISDAEELEVNIYNDNRHINIETIESDLQVEVYNALGQKVLSTTDRNFTLSQVSAGAYVVKAFNSKASKTQKVVVKQ